MVQEMGREMKGTRRGDERWETKGCQKVTKGGEGDGQRKEKRKKVITSFRQQMMPQKALG